MKKSDLITGLIIARRLTEIASDNFADKTQQICYTKHPLNQPTDLPPNTIQPLSSDIILNAILFIIILLKPKNNRR